VDGEGDANRMIKAINKVRHEKRKELKRLRKTQ